MHTRSKLAIPKPLTPRQHRPSISKMLQLPPTSEVKQPRYFPLPTDLHDVGVELENIARHNLKFYGDKKTDEGQVYFTCNLLDKALEIKEESCTSNP